MLAEVCNALLLTFVATEYLVQSNATNGRRVDFNKSIRSSRFIVMVTVVGLVNVMDRLSGLALYMNGLLEGFLHLPRIFFAAVAYIVALYIDCRRVRHSLNFQKEFVSATAAAFCYVLPVYPFMAVLISFGFMIVIDIFEFFKLPLEVLNAPIYYGTLYGPFSVVYWRVKRTMIERQLSLPS